MILEHRGDKNATDILYKHSNIVTRHTCLCQIKLHPNGGFIYISANNHATRTVNKRILRRVRVLPNHNSACAQKAKREKKNPIEHKQSNQSGCITPAYQSIQHLPKRWLPHWKTNQKNDSHNPISNTINQADAKCSCV